MKTSSIKLIAYTTISILVMALLSCSKEKRTDIELDQTTTNNQSIIEFQKQQIDNQKFEQYEDLKSVFIYGENVIVLGEQGDTIETSFGQELLFDVSLEGTCFSYPGDTILGGVRWYKVLTKDTVKAFILPGEVAMHIMSIESQNLKVVLRMGCGDGMPSYNSGYVMNEKKEVINKLGSYFSKGYWTSPDSTFIYLNTQYLMVYDAIDNSIKKLYQFPIYDFILNEASNTLAFITSFHNKKEDGDPLTRILGEIDLKDFSFKVLYEIKEEINFGYEAGDYGDFGLKIDQVNGENCYSFIIGKPNDPDHQIVNMKIDFKGKYLGEYKF